MTILSSHQGVQRFRQSPHPLHYRITMLATGLKGPSCSTPFILRWQPLFPPVECLAGSAHNVHSPQIVCCPLCATLNEGCIDRTRILPYSHNWTRCRYMIFTMLCCSGSQSDISPLGLNSYEFVNNSKGTPQLE